MFQLNILFKFINNDVYQQNVKFTEISMRNTDIEKSELPGKNSNESTIVLFERSSLTYNLGLVADVFVTERHF